MNREVLFPLFRDELSTHATALRQALASIAPGAILDCDATIDLATTAIRSAARAVDLAGAERLIAAFEACFEAGLALDAELDDLLEGVLAKLGELTGARDTDQAESLLAMAAPLIEALEARSAGRNTGQTSSAPDLGDLADLFRLECETHSTTLVDSLLELERNPGEPALIDKLLRAAHSLKGASRVVGQDSLVRLAHVAEAGLAETRRGERELAQAEFELLLGAADIFARIGLDGEFATTASIEALSAKLEVAARSREPSLLGETKIDTDAVRIAPSDAPRGGSAQTFPVVQPSQGSENEAPDERKRDGSAQIIDDTDRVLRVQASRLTGIVSLAGEALVESRRLKPLSEAQQRLRMRQATLADLVNELHQSLGAPPVDDPVGVRVAEIKARVAECRGLLGRWEAEFEEHARRAEELTLRLHREATLSRMRPLSDRLAGFPRLVRDLMRRLGKQVEFTVTGAEVPIDRDILDKLEAPLNHILRNALDHGIESPEDRLRAGKPAKGSIRIDAHHHAGTLRLVVSDDGRGIDPDRVRGRIVSQGILPEAEAAAIPVAGLFQYLFVPGFSTSDVVTEVSGRGVGMDVVQSVMHEIGGSVQVASSEGRGTTLEMILPVSRSVIRAVVVSIGGAPYAIPLARLDRLLATPRSKTRMIEDREYVLVDGKSVALVPAAQILELPGGGGGGDPIDVVVVSSRTHTFGFVVDGFLGEHDLVVRPLDPRLGRISDVSAAAILHDGGPVLIVDVDDLIASVVRLQQLTRIDKLQPLGSIRKPDAKRILIVDDSISVRELERRLLVDRGYEVEFAIDGVAGWALVRERRFDLAIVDVDMPRMDGFALTRSIKQDSRLRHLPVFIISYRDADYDRSTALEAGANAYMTKADFQNQDFLAQVVQLIGEPSRAALDASPESTSRRRG